MKKAEGKPGNVKPRENQINVTLREETRLRVESFVDRYFKQNKAQVIFEIVEQYIDSYERAQEAMLAQLVEQGAVKRSASGKSSTPALVDGRTRKSD